MAVKNAPYFAGEKDKDFRVVYCNHTGFQFNGLEIIIKFGVMNDLGDASAGYVDQVAVAMNAVNLKALSMTLDAAIKHHETLTGVEIPINPEIKKNIEASIAAATKKASP